MADPSKERIAAALALAEATCALATAVDCDGSVPPELLQARQDALRSYRATVQKLRTRAEVDAEIANLTRACVENEWAGGEDDYKRWELVTALCREETAPQCDECGLVQGTPEAKGVVMTFQTQGNQKWYCTRGGCAYEPNRITDHDADTRGLQDPEPCGCEETEALRDRIAKTKLFVQQSPKIGLALASEILRVLNGEA